jgi:hypothetical protein
MREGQQYDPLGDYVTDYDGEDIAFMRDDQGRASMVPRSLTRLSPDARQAVRAIQECAERISAEQERLDELVLSAREEYRVSWGAVGYAIATTSENARKRWGVG